ncbi:MAG: hypothetical protein ACM3JB_10160 [Acidobacteriaceae bacterium]
MEQCLQAPHPRSIHGPSADRCPWHASSRARKYSYTDQIDQLIRKAYLSRLDSKTRPDIRLLAKKVGVPHWVLKKRARELGLARTKELPWSEPELEILHSAIQFCITL